MICTINMLRVRPCTRRAGGRRLRGCQERRRGLRVTDGEWAWHVRIRAAERLDLLRLMKAAHDWGVSFEPLTAE